MVALTPTREIVRAYSAGSVFPTDVLTPGGSALVLFAAEFYGMQDAVFVADAGMEGTCVDVDGVRLNAMRSAYPESWQFFCCDAWEFADNAKRQWDVVTIDCPTNLFDACAASLPTWCRLARRAVVLGTGHATEVVAPDGWSRRDQMFRSEFVGGVYWSVLEPR